MEVDSHADDRRNADNQVADGSESSDDDNQPIIPRSGSFLKVGNPSTKPSKATSKADSKEGSKSQSNGSSRRSLVREAIVIAIKQLDDHKGVTRRQIFTIVETLCTCTTQQFGSALQASSGRESSLVVRALDEETGQFRYGLKEWDDPLALEYFPRGRIAFQTEDYGSGSGEDNEGHVSDTAGGESDGGAGSGASSPDGGGSSPMNTSTLRPTTPERSTQSSTEASGERRRKFQFTKQTIIFLEDEYRRNSTPEIPRLKELADILDCRHYRTICKWFSKKRASENPQDVGNERVWSGKDDKEDRVERSGTPPPASEDESVPSEEEADEKVVPETENTSVKTAKVSGKSTGSKVDNVTSTTSRGVTATSSGKYLARLAYQGKRFNLGVFSTAKEAAKAYNVRARELGMKPTTVDVVSNGSVKKSKKKKSGLSAPAPASDKKNASSKSKTVTSKSGKDNDIRKAILTAMNDLDCVFSPRSQVWAHFVCNCSREEFNDELAFAVCDASSGVLKQRDDVQKIWVYGLKAWVKKKSRKQQPPKGVGKEASKKRHDNREGSRSVHKTKKKEKSKVNSNESEKQAGASNATIADSGATPSSGKKFRIDHHLELLQDYYLEHPTPSGAELRQLAAQVGCQQTRTLAKWFKKVNAEGEAFEASESAVKTAKRKKDAAVTVSSDADSTDSKKARVQSSEDSEDSASIDEGDGIQSGDSDNASDDDGNDDGDDSDNDNDMSSPSKRRRLQNPEVTDEDSGDEEMADNCGESGATEHDDDVDGED